jgi:hypothetical protein
LRHVLREMRISNHAQRGGVNQVHVSADELRESGFGSASGEIGQELLVVQRVHSLIVTIAVRIGH